MQTLIYQTPLSIVYCCGHDGPSDLSLVWVWQSSSFPSKDLPCEVMIPVHRSIPRSSEFPTPARERDLEKEWDYSLNCVINLSCLLWMATKDKPITATFPKINQRTFVSDERCWIKATLADPGARRRSTVPLCNHRSDTDVAVTVVEHLNGEKCETGHENGSHYHDLVYQRFLSLERSRWLWFGHGCLYFCLFVIIV